MYVDLAYWDDSWAEVQQIASGNSQVREGNFEFSPWHEDWGC